MQITSSALCHGTACSAWIEENTIDPEIIDCGWPTIRFLKQNKSIDEAVNELFKLGDKLRASADTRKTEDSIDAQSILDEEKIIVERKVPPRKAKQLEQRRRTSKFHLLLHSFVLFRFLTYNWHLYKRVVLHS